MKKILLLFLLINHSISSFIYGAEDIARHPLTIFIALTSSLFAASKIQAYRAKKLFLLQEQATANALQAQKDALYKQNTTQCEDISKKLVAAGSYISNTQMRYHTLLGKIDAKNNKIAVAFDTLDELHQLFEKTEGERSHYISRLSSYIQTSLKNPENLYEAKTIISDQLYSLNRISDEFSLKDSLIKQAKELEQRIKSLNPQFEILGKGKEAFKDLYKYRQELLKKIQYHHNIVETACKKNSTDMLEVYIKQHYRSSTPFSDCVQELEETQNMCEKILAKLKTHKATFSFSFNAELLVENYKNSLEHTLGKILLFSSYRENIRHKEIIAAATQATKELEERITSDYKVHLEEAVEEIRKKYQAEYDSAVKKLYSQRRR